MHELASAEFERALRTRCDIGDLDVLVTIAQDAGLDPDLARAQLHADALNAQIAERAEMARSAGISGVPTFIFDGSQGFSGAQPEDVFLEVFDQLTAKGNPDPGS